MSKHTRLSWTIKKATEDGVYIVFWEGLQVARVLGASKVEAKTNAEFIIKACNTYNTRPNPARLAGSTPARDLKCDTNGAI